MWNEPDITHAIKVRQEELEAPNVSLVPHGRIIKSLVDFLNGRPIEGPFYASYLQHITSGDKPNTLNFQGVQIADSGGR